MSHKVYFAEHMSGDEPNLFSPSAFVLFTRSTIISRKGLMKIYLQILLAVCLLTANVNASSDPRNLLQIGTNFIPYPWYFQTGLSYDHLVGKKFTIGTSLWYERASMDVLDWHGLVAEASAKFLVWRFSEQSFGPSL